MNPIRHVRLLAATLAGLVSALLAFAAAAPAAFAAPHPTPIIPMMDKHPPLSPAHHGLVPASVRTVVVGGMPGWQIALIAIAAALLAATGAVLADRAWTAHRKTVSATA
jgi:energy-converting hydrogenase Eha subunit F